VRKLIFGLALVAVFISSPLVTIWAVNTLFDAGIPYTAQTWAAAFILIITVNYQRGVHREHRPKTESAIRPRQGQMAEREVPREVSSEAQRRP
jgi:hypothetical protein